MYSARATNTLLTIGQQLGMLAVMLLTSTVAAGMAGGGFIGLTATLSTIGTIPAVGHVPETRPGTTAGRAPAHAPASDDFDDEFAEAAAR